MSERAFPTELWEEYPLGETVEAPPTSTAQPSVQVAPMLPPATEGGVPIFIVLGMLFVVTLSVLWAGYAVKKIREPLPGEEDYPIRPDDVGEAGWTMRADNMFGGGR